MKFEEIKNLKIPQKKYSKKEIFKNKSSLNIKSIKRYDNLAIILMNPGIKGSLKQLSNLVNSGEKNCSWTIRITFKDNEWIISIASYNGVNRDNINIDIFDIINEFKDIVNITGNKYIGFIKTGDKQIIENIINSLISKISNNEIQDIKSFPINNKFSIDNNQHEFKILYDYSNNKNINLKELETINLLLQQDIPQQDINNILILKENINNITSENLNYLNTLSNQYISNQDRLGVAIKFMI